MACGNNGEPDTTATFDVVVENVGEAYDFTASGVFNTPVGAAAPAPIGPGEAYEFMSTRREQRASRCSTDRGARSPVM
jgi:hypothetical protein